MAPNVRLPARTLVIVGDTTPAMGRAALVLAEEHGWPVISEPSGNARRGPNAISTGGLLLEVGSFVDQFDRSTSSWSVDRPCRAQCWRCCATPDRQCRSSRDRQLG